MKRALSTKAVEAMKPDPNRRLEIPDPALSGLYLVIQPSGAKSWALRYRFSGRPRKLTLGKWPVMGVADARGAAGAAIEAVEHGTDPGAVKQATKRARQEQADRDTVQALVDLHARRHLSTLKTGATVKRELDRHVVARWGERDIHEITRRDIVDLLDEIVDSGREVTANRVRGYLGKFFNWCVERDVIDASPMVGVKAPAKERSRDRVLTDDELRWFWAACDRVGWPWGSVGQLLLLTGQRLGEVVGMRESEFEGELWALPGDRTKNGQPHVVPLSGAARDVLAASPRVAGRAGLIFTTTGATPLSGFDKGKRHLAEAMSEIAVEGRANVVEIPRWTFHDLRRTAATGMARLGQPVHVVEAVLNHRSGAISGVAGVYNRHAYEDEKRVALEAWARYLADLTQGRAANVVELRTETS